MARREFTVQDDHHYDRRSPVRWIASHILRHKRFVALLLAGSIVANTLGAPHFQALHSNLFVVIELLLHAGTRRFAFRRLAAPQADEASHVFLRVGCIEIFGQLLQPRLVGGAKRRISILFLRQAEDA